MWLGWRERVDVYLGAGALLVRRRRRDLVSLELPATLPLGDAMAQVDHLCARDRARPWSLHVYLSGALCPAVPFTLPAGVKRQKETLALARAAAAVAWGLPAEEAQELVCALDLHRPNLAAALMPDTHQQIQTWARLRGGRLASLQPLWAVAASAPGCRPRHIQRLHVHEPGAVTALGGPSGSTGSADDGIGVRFSPQALPHRQQWPQGPAAWAGHWELLA